MTHLLALLLLGVSFHSDFESGSLGKVEQISPTHFRCALQGEADHEGRNRQVSWYYFRLDGVAGREITLDLVDLVGEYDYRPGAHSVTKGTRPVYSYDGKAWRHFTDREIQWDERAISLRVQFRPLKDPVWIAHIPPYTSRDFARLLSDLRGNQNLKEEVIGRSVQGRDLWLLTVTDPAAPEASKKVIWLMVRQHAWEAGTSWVAEGLLRFLLSSDPRAARIRREAVFKIFPMADPDGVARGGVRFNVNGYDLNRNWDAVNPKLMPEIAAERKAVLDWVDAGKRIDIFLTLHNTENQEFLEGPLSAGDAGFRGLAERFSRALAATTTFNATRPPGDSSQGLNPAQAGRMTVDQGLFHDRRVPALLMEQMVEYNSRLGRLPDTPDRLQFGEALARALWTAVATPP